MVGLGVNVSSLRRRTIAAVGVVLVAAGCSGSDSSVETPVTAESAAAVEPAGSTVEPVADPSVEPVPICDLSDRPEAPLDLYRDEPVYEDGERIVMKVEPYARSLDGFVALWWDPEHNGWIHVGFYGADVAARQEQLDNQFPNEGVVAVAMPYDRSELLSMEGDLNELLPSSMSVGDPIELIGKIPVNIGLITADSLDELARLASGYPVCAMGVTEDDYFAPGPQALSGDGWRFLTVADRAIGRQPRVITSEEGLAALWAAIGETAAVPDVDFGPDLVIAIEVGVSGSCPDSRFDGFLFDDGLMYAKIGNPTLQRDTVCTAGYSPRTYVLAVSRSILPEPPYELKAGRDYATGTSVDVDLRESGSEAPAELAALPDLDGSDGPPREVLDTLLEPVAAKHEITESAVAAPDQVAFSRVAYEKAGEQYTFWAFFAPGESAIAKQLFGTSTFPDSSYVIVDWAMGVLVDASEDWPVTFGYSGVCADFDVWVQTTGDSDEAVAAFTEYWGNLDCDEVFE